MQYSDGVKSIQMELCVCVWEGGVVAIKQKGNSICLY